MKVHGEGNPVKGIAVSRFWHQAKEYIRQIQKQINLLENRYDKTAKFDILASAFFVIFKLNYQYKLLINIRRQLMNYI